VRYLISGGAGAELLTENSYYHYMIANIGDSNKITMVELPSPANNYVARFWSTVQLFAKAMYEENPVSVVLIISGLVLLGLVLIFKISLLKKHFLIKLGKWLSDIGKYAVRRFKELFGKNML
jgi:hypothetical protein